MAKNKTGELATTQEFVQMAAVKGGTLILKSGEFRRIIMCSSLNFALKSEKEQTALISGYQNFLNSLDFPVQIVIQSRRADLKPYLDDLKRRLQSQQNELVAFQMSSYIEFVSRLLEIANIMRKRFFVVVPYTPVGVKKETLVGKVSHPAQTPKIKISPEQWTKIEEELNKRVGVAQNYLQSLGIKTALLSTQQIIELFYGIYNPEEAVEERLVEEETLQAPIVERKVENAASKS